MRVTVLNHTRHGIVVHKVGCADIARERRKLALNSEWNIEIDGDIATAVSNDLNASFGWPDTYKDADGTVTEPAPWAPSDIRVMPCVKVV